jgi:hypothetical protein
MTSWIQIAALFDPVEGAVLASALRAGGVRVAEPDLNIHSLYPDRRLTYGGYRIWVYVEDMELAREIARDWRHTSPEPVEACPECGFEARRATDWFMQALFFLVFAFSFNYRLKRQRRHCRACGHHWTPDRKPAAPFTAQELGYDPNGLSKAEMPNADPAIGSRAPDA